ncbi:MAG: hypothetical protein ACJ72H_29000 [Candidatus Sulfotelmatobacter sp.]
MNDQPAADDAIEYELDICEAIQDHHLCPGTAMLKAGDIELGPVICKCPCHKRSELKQ